MFNLKKNILVGVAVSPENGIEAAQIDYNNRTVLKYASKPLAYDNARKEIADLDLFKETLQDLLKSLKTFFNSIKKPCMDFLPYTTFLIKRNVLLHNQVQHRRHPQEWLLSIPPMRVFFHQLEYG